MLREYLSRLSRTLVWSFVRPAAAGLNPGVPRTGRSAAGSLAGIVFGGLALAACSGLGSGDQLPGGGAPSGAPQQQAAIGAGNVRVALILPMSASGNAGIAAASMRNAAELALAEFNNPDIQLLVKDDGGTAQGAQTAAQQALAEGAEIILGPLFAHSVGAVGQIARSRNVPVIAFSTDASVASRGVYLLSFLPESDVDRVVDYAFQSGKRSFAALIPEDAYGSVAEAAFIQAVSRRNGRIVAQQRYSRDAGRMQQAVQQASAGMRGADAIFIPDRVEGLRAIVPMITAAGIDTRRAQLLGTGAWDDSQVFANPALQGGWYATVDPAGFRSFANRYRAKYGQEPVRTATLAYDAVALVAALAKTQGPQRFAPETLTSASGFTGIDGLFRFRPEGPSQRGLAVMRVTPSGGQIIGQPPKAFAPGS